MAYDYLRLLPVVPLAGMALEDFRRREISVVWVGVYIIAAAAAGIWSDGLRMAAMNTLYNGMLLAYMAGGVMLYLRLSRKAWVDPFKTHVGQGDALFLLGTIPLFDLRHYLFFLMAGLGISLLWWVIRRRPTIPLVGTMGVTLCGILIYHSLIE